MHRAARPDVRLPAARAPGLPAIDWRHTSDRNYKVEVKRLIFSEFNGGNQLVEANSSLLHLPQFREFTSSTDATGFFELDIFSPYGMPAYLAVFARDVDFSLDADDQPVGARGAEHARAADAAAAAVRSTAADLELAELALDQAQIAWAAAQAALPDGLNDRILVPTSPFRLIISEADSGPTLRLLLYHRFVHHVIHRLHHFIH